MSVLNFYLASGVIKMKEALLEIKIIISEYDESIYRLVKIFWPDIPRKSQLNK